MVLILVCHDVSLLIFLRLHSSVQLRMFPHPNFLYHHIYQNGQKWLQQHLRLLLDLQMKNLYHKPCPDYNGILILIQGHYVKVKDKQVIHYHKTLYLILKLMIHGDFCSAISTFLQGMTIYTNARYFPYQVMLPLLHHFPHWTFDQRMK